jgi:hypothetical protein
VRSANNFDPLRPARYVQWMDVLETAKSDQKEKMLAMMGITVIERIDQASETGVRLEPFAGNERFRWIPCAWLAFDGDRAWELLFDKPPDLDRDFVILEGYETNAQWVCGNATVGEIRLISESPNEIRFQIETESSGWLFVADTWYPGWTAEVNELKTSIYRANYLFRAISVPTGGGEVVMRFKPLGFYFGVAGSLMGWLAFGFLTAKNLVIPSDFKEK